MPEHVWVDLERHLVGHFRNCARPPPAQEDGWARCDLRGCKGAICRELGDVHESGMSVEELADYLCRDVDEVRAKIDEVERQIAAAVRL
jgi:hypothetical protein